MKKITKALALALCLSCVAGTAAACNSEPDAGSPDTIRILAALDEAKFDEDNNFEKQVEEATGINLEFTYVGMNDYETTVNNTLLTQKNIDLVSGGPDPTALINQEALYPLTDLMETEMPDYLKYLTPEYEAQMLYEYEGKKDIYVIKSIREAEQGYSFMVRKDWMERVGVTKAPTTWTEFVNMLQQFKDKDANYGIKDVHYTQMEDGSKRIKDIFCTFANARKAGLLYDPMPFMWANDSYIQMATGNSDPDEMTATGKLFYDALTANEGHYMSQAYDMSTGVWQDKKTALSEMLDDFETNMITGELSLDNYDAELKKILDAGLAECEAEQREAYQELVTKN